MIQWWNIFSVTYCSTLKKYCNIEESVVADPVDMKLS